MASRDEIRRELAAMRAALARDAHHAAADARTLVDWRHHFRRHPWLCCAGAAVVGYLVVPRRQRPLEFDASILQDVAALRPAALAAASPRVESMPASLLKAAVSTAATALLRRSVSHLVERGRRHFEESRVSALGDRSNGAHSRSH